MRGARTTIPNPTPITAASAAMTRTIGMSFKLEPPLRKDAPIAGKLGGGDRGCHGMAIRRKRKRDGAEAAVPFRPVLGSQVEPAHQVAIACLMTCRNISASMIFMPARALLIAVHVPAPSWSSVHVVEML